LAVTLVAAGNKFPEKKGRLGSLKPSPKGLANDSRYASCNRCATKSLKNTLREQENFSEFAARRRMVFLTNQPKNLVKYVPRATYRLQLRSGFGFDEVAHLIDYLHMLGVSDLYLSPLFRARRESSHGYDVVDHATIEPEFGTLNSFQATARATRKQGMGILLDLVPNHMGINDPGNKWWHDVLESGELSRYAKNFDIDWDRHAENLRHKILLPTLSDHFGHELEQGKLHVVYKAGRFYVDYFGAQFPLAPDTWPAILNLVTDQAKYSRETTAQLRTIVDRLQNLPSRDDHSEAAREYRYHSQGEATRQLKEMERKSPDFRPALAEALSRLNGRPGDPASFDELEQLLNRQWYRLANWRAAADEINYRRFFDINDLAAIRVEDPEVFEAVHALADKLLKEDLITGLRIDHPDGLLNPPQYFDDLQRMFQQHRGEGEGANNKLYVVVEKILTGEEPLPQSWPVSGTTGYELLNDISRLLVSGPGLETLRNEYETLCDVEETPLEVIYASKKQILAESMSSELHMLAGRLHRLTQRHRMSRDFTFSGLLRALGEVIACFPVYRTYVPPQGWEVDDADYGRVMTAVRWTKIRNPTMDWTTLDFIASVLLLQFPSFDEPDREHFRDFVLRFQQVTGPVTAKGIEDTSFYRYYPLAALNEVGGELTATAHTAEDFHRRMQHRAADWPHGLSATATHDTKRGEDVRARLLVLSEVADDWLLVVRRWRELNRPLFRTIRDSQVPNPNEEYLLYQTVVGTWPGKFTNDAELSEYTNRITAYMQKALREAKQSTSWASPAEDYENAVLDFTRDLLNPVTSGQFHNDLSIFVESIADAGFINGMAQVVLKATVPGVPDTYQGCEHWDFNLVDPDNRRPVDYAKRREQLYELASRYRQDPKELLESLLQDWPHSRLKLFVTWRLLQARSHSPELFANGEYIPLTISGARSNHVLAFARRYDEQWALCIVPMHIQELVKHGRNDSFRPPVVGWGDTVIELPSGAPPHWHDALAEQTLATETGADGSYTLPVARALSTLPVSVLLSQN
jgi:(1->4)-alpha-D-glucan 1-alpha-D-glucosylmutase